MKVLPGAPSRPVAPSASLACHCPAGSGRTRSASPAVTPVVTTPTPPAA